MVCMVCLFFFLDRIVLATSAHHEEDEEDDGEDEDDGDDDDNDDSPHGESTAVLVVPAAAVHGVVDGALAREGLLVVAEAVGVTARFRRVAGVGTAVGGEANDQIGLLGRAGILHVARSRAE